MLHVFFSERAEQNIYMGYIPPEIDQAQYSSVSEMLTVSLQNGTSQLVTGMCPRK
jgi:hypothetical protein